MLRLARNEVPDCQHKAAAAPAAAHGARRASQGARGDGDDDDDDEKHAGVLDPSGAGPGGGVERGSAAERAVHDRALGLGSLPPGKPTAQLLGSWVGQPIAEQPASRQDNIEPREIWS